MLEAGPQGSEGHLETPVSDTAAMAAMDAELRAAAPRQQKQSAEGNQERRQAHHPWPTQAALHAHLAAQLPGLLVGLHHLRLQALLLHSQALDQAYHAVSQLLQQLHKGVPAAAAGGPAAAGRLARWGARAVARAQATRQVALQAAGVCCCCLLQAGVDGGQDLEHLQDDVGEMVSSEKSDVAAGTFMLELSTPIARHTSQPDNADRTLCRSWAMPATSA